MRSFWKLSLVVSLLLTVPAHAYVELRPPVDFAPLGQGIDDVIPVDLLELDDSMMAVFLTRTGPTKWDSYEVWVRPFSLDGEPLTPSRVFVSSLGASMEVTAATNGREVLLVTGHWGTDLIDLRVLDAEGNVVGGPLQIRGRVGAAEATDEGWTVLWSPPSHMAKRVEGVRLTSNLEILVDTIEPVEGAELSQLLRTSSGIIAVMRSASGVTLYELEGSRLVPRVEVGSTDELIEAFWNGEQVALLLRPSVFSGSMEFISLSSSLQVLHRREISLEAPCSRIAMEWVGHQWLLSCTDGYDGITHLYRLSSDGRQLDAAPLVLERTLVADIAYQSHATWIVAFSDFDANGTHEWPKPYALTRLEDDSLVVEHQLSQRAANTIILEMIEWGRDWLVIHGLEGTLMATIVSRAGRPLFHLPLVAAVDARENQRVLPSRVAITTSDDAVYVISPRESDRDTVSIVTLRRTSADRPSISIDELSLEEDFTVAGAAAGESGLLLYYTSRPWGVTIHNLVLLNDEMEPVAERKFDQNFPPIRDLVSVGPNFFLGLAWEGFAVEVLNERLETTVPRLPVIPPVVNPQRPLMSANDGRLLVAWINGNDHVRTVVLDSEGQIISGAGGGTVVSLGGGFDSHLTVTPRGNRWMLSWMAVDEGECNSTSHVYRIVVDAAGQLLTPFPHEPRYQFHKVCEDTELAPDGSAVVLRETLYEQPYARATRSLIQFAPTRLRPVSRR